MVSTPLNEERKKQFIALMLFSLALRVVFLFWNKGEYTDGIIQLTLFSESSRNTFFMPFYTMLCTLLSFVIKDMEICGKLVSMIAGVLGMIPVYLLGRKLYNHRTGQYAAILYVVSPEIWRWHLRIMTDALFCSLFIWSIYHIINVLLPEEHEPAEIHPINQLGFAWFAGGLAILTRYQGIALLPLLIIATIQIYRSMIPPLTSKKNLLTAILIWLLSFSSWFGAPLWWVIRGMGHWGQYSERAAMDLGTTLAAYLTMAEGFIVFMPYEMTYTVFIFLLYGLFKTNYTKSHKWFYGILAYLYLAWLTAHAPFQSFQFRYFIPIISMAVIPAAYGLTAFEDQVKDNLNKLYLRRWISFAVVTISLLFAVISIFVQQETFGDYKDSALYIREKLAGKHIYDNEVYRAGVYNVKMRFWSGQPLEYYDIAKLQPGDYVCLHNVQGDIKRELGLINQNFVIIPEAEFQAQTLPLLADIMLTPPVTSRPEALLYKFFPQQFSTVLIRVESRPTP